MRYWIRVVLINLMLTAAGLVIFELIFGGFLRDNRLSRLNLIRGRSIRYELNGLYAAKDPTVLYSRDQFGLRGSYRSPSAIDILTVGGSATDQRFISDDATWQEQMHRLWRERGREVSVVNAGIDGQSTLGHLKNFEWWFPSIPGLHPKYILFYIGVNDLFGNAGTHWDSIEDKAAGKNSFTPEEKAALNEFALTKFDETSFWSELEDRSAILLMYRTIRGMISAHAVRIAHGRGFQRQAQHWTTEQRLTDHRPVIADDLEKYAARVRGIITATKKMGARPIIVAQSANYFLRQDGKLLGFNDRGFMFKGIEVTGVDIYHFLRLFNETALGVCRAERDCIAIDGLNVFPLGDGDFYDNVHNTPQGARKIAESLVKELSPLVLGPLEH